MSAINIVIDGPPSHNAGRFVEVETDDGRGISVGEWKQREDGMWALRITELPGAPELPVMTCGHGAVICARCDFIPPSWKPQL